MKLLAVISTVLVLLACTMPDVRPAGSTSSSVAASQLDHGHASWTAVLAKHVDGDRFDYAALAKDRAPLDRYLRTLESVTPADHDAWTREQRYAFWINAYNAYTIAVVVDRYPIESIKDISTLFSEVWDQEVAPLKALFPAAKGKRLTLNDIEHRILRPVYSDARVHAAVNCASVGCPPLRNEAFVAEKLEVQLEEQARRWLADPARNRFEREKNRVEVSEIFDWFEADFVRDAGSVQAWIAKYAPAAEATWIASAKKLEIDHLDYSWKLNAAAK